MTTPNILLVGSPVETSIEQMYFRAFKSIGCSDVDILDVEGDIEWWKRSKVVHRVLPDLGNKKAGLILEAYLRNSRDKYSHIILFKGMQFSRKLLDRCRGMTPSACWININPDNPWNSGSRAATNINVLESLDFFDAYCTWSLSIVEKLKGIGCRNCIYLPFGYDAQSHTPPNFASKYRSHTLVFIGSWDHAREDLLAKLAGVEVDLRIYGNGWHKAARSFPWKNSVKNGEVFGPEMAAITTSSMLCLNPMRAQNFGAHNMRTFEIPAMGGLMLTTRSEEQNSFFPENEASYMYDDIEELREKILYIANHSVEADRVRARGMELVREHSYSSRAQYLLEAVK